jgi:protein ImuB
MAKRFVSVWFRHLMTDWFTIRDSSLKDTPFVLAVPDHGRMLITSVNASAQSQGIEPGMVVADARAIFPTLNVLNDEPGIPERILNRLAEWCIRFTPVTAIDLPDGLLLDASGCPHLWSGDEQYLREITKRLNERGYDVQLAIADTIGAAWAVARYGNASMIVESGRHYEALLPLPPESLRIDKEVSDRLHKLGLRCIHHFIDFPKSALKRRFGNSLIQRLNQAFGKEQEFIIPVEPIEPYQERLPCLEPIVNATGIEIALNRLLDSLCTRLQKEGKGIRKAIFKAYRLDGKMEAIAIGTNHASHSMKHLFKLFEEKIQTIEPDLGIELFILEASKVEDAQPRPAKLWTSNMDLQSTELAELLDRIAMKTSEKNIHRYLPDEHYLPEESFKPAVSITETTVAKWQLDQPRPVLLLDKPERIEVMAPVPDYPPMLFIYNGKRHKIIRADGPERIEQPWWLHPGEHRDYYYVEDEEGRRYWLFRSGHYQGDKTNQWFIHGFFA